MNKMKDKLEKKGYTYRVYGINDDFGKITITLKKDEERAKIKLQKNKVIIEPCKQQTINMQKVLIEQVELYVKRMGYSHMEIKSEDSFLKSMDYIEIDGVWMKELGSEKSYIAFCRKIRNVVEESTKEVENVSFRLEMSSWTFVKVHIKTVYQQQWMMVHEDMDGGIAITNKQSKFSFTEEEFALYIKEWIEKEEKIQRLQSVFRKPHPYLSDLLRVTYGLKNMKNTTENQVSAALLKHYSYEEIEILAKEKRETKELQFMYKKGDHYVLIIPLGNLYVFLCDGKVEVGTEKETYIQKLEKKVVEWAFGRAKLSALKKS